MSYTRPPGQDPALCITCRRAPAVDACEKSFPGLGLCQCRHCHAVGRLSYPCPCMSLDEAKRIREADHSVALCRCMSPEERERFNIEHPKEDPKMAAKKKTNGDSKDMVERARYEEKLPCKIAPEAVQLCADELAKVIREREETLERKRAANAAYREKIAYFDERLTELAESVEGKTERRNVEVAEYLMTRTNEIRVVRLDTGEIVSTRTADAADLQEAMSFSEGENPGPVVDDSGQPKRKRGRPKKDATAEATAE